jgi:hypothetical protein
MVDTGVPGDVVTVAGIVKVTNPDLEKPGELLLLLEVVISIAAPLMADSPVPR